MQMIIISVNVLPIKEMKRLDRDHYAFAGKSGILLKSGYVDSEIFI